MPPDNNPCSTPANDLARISALSISSYRPESPGQKEAELLDHYMRHTSYAIGFEGQDTFALRVGIPELATRCPALMSSLLALAASCCCCDIMSHPAPIPRDRERMVQLLATANRHHLNSLQEIQALICKARHYDQILANALLMAAYGTSAQRVRIWLADNTPAHETLADEFQPNNSGWMTLFHSVDSAFATVPRSRSASRGVSEDEEATTDSSPGLDAWTFQPEFHTPRQQQPRPNMHDQEVMLLTKQPMALSNHPMYSAIVSTSPWALGTLKATTDRLCAILDEMDVTWSSTLPTEDLHPPLTKASTLQACRPAMEILLGVAAGICPPGVFSHNIHIQNQHQSHSDWNGGDGVSGGGGGGTTCSQSQSQIQNLRRHMYFNSNSNSNSNSHTSFTSISPSSDVSDWLREYISRVLADIPSRSTRRIIMAFLYRVPQHFVNTVRGILDCFPDGPISLCPAETLCIDIFAHWLCFTLLLDGVWFIGDIGLWELDRIVGMVETGRLDLSYGVNRNGNGAGGGDWWPAGIYRIAVEVKKYARR